MMLYTRFQTSLWEIFLVGNEQGLTHLHMETGQGKRRFNIEQSFIRKDVFFAETRKQIEEYLAGQRTSFTVRLNPHGTDYQKKVWNALCDIPYGEVRSYKEIAAVLGNPKGARSVGMANGKNPIPIIVPCHRVVGSNGELTGFAHGMQAKEQLLRLEQTNDSKGKEHVCSDV